MTRIIGRYNLLLFMSILMGFISAIAHPLSSPVPSIIRSIILALCLSAGTIIINRLNWNNLNSKSIPNLIRSSIVGIIMGLIAGFIMASGITNINGEKSDFKQTDIILCAVYGLLLHTAYALRWYFKNKTATALVSIIIASLIAGLVRLYFMYSQNNIGELSIITTPAQTPAFAILTLLTTSLPFSLLWLLINIACDPAWSFNRWEMVKTSTVNAILKDNHLILSSIIYPIVIIVFFLYSNSAATANNDENTFYIIMLTGFLSIGTATLNKLSKDNLDRQEQPSLISAIITGGFYGLGFCCILICISLAIQHNQVRLITRYYIDMKDVAYYTTTFMLYGIIVFSAYGMRWIIRNQTIHFFIMLIAGVLCSTIIFLLLPSSNISFIVPILLVMIWYFIHRYSDPAWSFERWQSLVKGEQ